jgi:hypothetical protein
MSDYYVKIQSKQGKYWLKVKTDKKGIPIEKNGYQSGTCLKQNKTLTFHPSDVIAFYQGSLSDVTGLGMAYIPTADVCMILDTVVPDSMGYETHIAARIVQEKIGKPLREFVSEKLHYKNAEICKALSAEQVDAVALAIYNIEYKKQGMIIGDQTGIGKGRVAAAMIRYGYYNKMKPIFLSEKPNLFSDIYRDLKDIGSEDLVPFIVNGRASKTNIKNAEGDIVHRALPKTEQEKIFKDLKFPSGYDFACATYSQFASVKRNPTKPNFLRAIAQNNLLIMDESHNASGTSNTGEFLQEVLIGTKGVVFLSATFAKRPDNMPVYALKTSIADANMSKDQLIEAIQNGGVALQEILASQLVSEGQMIRRERSFEGVEVNYFTLTEKEQEHKAVFDNITDVLRDIIQFQKEYINGEVEQLDEIAAAEGKQIEERKGTSKAGVDNQPYFSKVFQVINQILFSLKARSVAEMAVERMKEGKKPIIAFSSTMESFIEQMTHDDGRPVTAGDTINLDYKVALQKGLDGVMRYTVTDVKGNRTSEYFKIEQMSLEAQEMYYDIQSKINKISTGISLSPIDVIKDIVRKAGFTIDEVTGRKYEIQLIDGTNTGVLLNRKKILANDAFRQFNDNELDCLMINQSGSTGASAHAIVTNKVKKEDVKQRVMLVLQPELDINREVQKRGRINRTGQILKPIYDYVSSAIPAERRLMMMLRKKLKSLDANTTSNQKQSENILKVDDFLNKYGNKVVTDYLSENPEINELLDDPLKLNDSESTAVLENAASKVSGRVAVLTTEQQEKFYADVIDMYSDYVEYLKQAGTYDLEIEALNFEAETKEVKTVIEGKSGSSVFSENTVLETVEVNVLKKPFTSDELQSLLNQNLNGKDAKAIQEELIDDAKQFYAIRLKKDIEKTEKRYEKLIHAIWDEPACKKLKLQKDKQDYFQQRATELQDAQEKAIEREELKSQNTLNNILRVLNFFYVGKFLHYPIMSGETAKSVCLGININKKKNNPYAPSAVKVKIAIANSDKYIDLTISGEPGKKLNDVMAYSMGSNYDEKNIVKDWEYFCKDANVNRKNVHIVTGNILQGFGTYTGKLISFTTKDGSIRKGILMPDNFDPVKNMQNFVNVPISKAWNYIKKIDRSNTRIATSNGKVIFEKYYGWDDKDFALYIPANKFYQKFYKDAKIIKLCTNPRDGFERKSGQMIAYFSLKNMKRLVDHLSEKFNLSVVVSQSVYDEYFDKKENVIKTKTAIQERAEKTYEKDKVKFEKRQKQKIQSKQAKKSNQKPSKDKRLRIVKVKAQAKLKMLELLRA